MPDDPSLLEPFIARTDPAALEDLRARLLATPRPDEPQDAGWSLGADLGYLRELVTYWRTGSTRGFRRRRWHLCRASVSR